MRILLLTQYYPPEPVFKFADLARGLVQRGHDVQVITGFPCYPAGRTNNGFRQRLFDEHTVDRVVVTRVPQFPDHSRSIIRRALYYISFALSAMSVGLWRMRQADVILVYQSALPTALAAWFMSRVRRVPYVLDVADLWPESVAASGMLRNRAALKLIRACMQFAYSRASRIVVITDGYRDRLMELGVPREKLSLIYYWAPSGQFDPVPRDEQLIRNDGLAGRFNVMYSGTMGPVQDLGAVIDAAAIISDDLPAVQFVMIGDGLELDNLKKLATDRNLANVRFLGRRSPAEVQRLTQAADALLVHLKPDSLTQISIPSKTFACMASGRPILMAVEGESSRLIEKHGCGIVARPSDPNALAAAVRRLVTMSETERLAIGDAGRNAFLNNYCSDTQIPKVEQLLIDTSAVRTARYRPKPKQSKATLSFYQRRGKRALDFALSATTLTLLLPLLLIVALAVRLRLGSPVLFVQERPGYDGRPFKLYKFRTMRDIHDAAGRQLTDADRLTPFGRFLRATSLDELPELWNVLRGDMSLVGPRPLLPEYLPLYSQQQFRRHEMRPGITGWAQIHGRNAVAWEERLERDVWYVDHSCLALDLNILLATFWQVLRRRGVTMPGHATMPRFTGSSTTPSDGRQIAATQEKRAVVIGAGGHAKVVIGTLQAAGWIIDAAYDDDRSKHGQRVLGVEIRGPIADLDPQTSMNAVIAIGDASLRRSIASHFDFDWITVVHPTAWVDPSAVLGPGTVVCAGSIIQPECRIGRHAIINTLAGIDHDCTIGDYAHIGPGACLAGGVHVGVASQIGAGATVIPSVSIGSDTTVGAGATVISDLPDAVVAVGVPARVVTNRKPTTTANDSLHRVA